MSKTLSERRMAENQVVFRKLNEQVQKNLDQANAIATEEGQGPIHFDSDTPLHFYCECSDNNCRKRIRISLKAYNKIHEARNNFTIVCGHEVSKLEDVISEGPEYCVVAKHEVPPESVNKLHKTDIDNT